MALRYTEVRWLGSFTAQVIWAVSNTKCRSLFKQGRELKKFILMLLLALGLNGVTLADNGIISEGVVIQANGKDAADFKRALILASNMHEEMPHAKFELIVFGPSVKLLTAFSDAVPLIQKIQSEGIQIIACGRSLKTENLNDADLTPNIKVEPFGAVWLVNRQKQGWQYIKP